MAFLIMSIVGSINGCKLFSESYSELVSKKKISTLSLESHT